MAETFLAPACTLAFFLGLMAIGLMQGPVPRDRSDDEPQRGHGGLWK